MVIRKEKKTKLKTEQKTETNKTKKTNKQNKQTNKNLLILVWRMLYHINFSFVLKGNFYLLFFQNAFLPYLQLQFINKEIWSSLSFPVFWNRPPLLNLISSTSILVWWKIKNAVFVDLKIDNWNIEIIWSKKLQKYLKNYDICENVKFGAISWKFDNLSITA